MPNISNPIYFGPKWLERRQLGIPNALGSRGLLCKQMYNYNDSFLLNKSSEHGAIFSLECNPQGTVLVAATEKKNILLFDPVRCSPISVIPDAHEDCVNCIKFIDSNYFATSSDDRTVSIWDMRNLNKSLYNLVPHSNWVKSISYSEKDKVLLTSAFDGNIFTWSWNKGTICDHSNAFNVNGLMRSCLSKDGTKLVISTAGGYMIVVHNLNLLTLQTDLINLKPNIYRLMQLSQTELHKSKEVTSLFKGFGKRNRIEFLSDYPEGNNAEIIASIQIHPEGNCLFSRNTSLDEASEWSCVHDIEEWEKEWDSDDYSQVGWPTIAPKTQPPTHIIIPSNVIHSTDQNDLQSSPNDIWEAIVAINANQRGNARSTARDNTPIDSRRLNIQYRWTDIDVKNDEHNVVTIDRVREANEGTGDLRMEYEMNETERLQASSVSTIIDGSRPQRVSLNPEWVVPVGIFRNQRGLGTSLRRHNVLSLRVVEDISSASQNNLPINDVNDTFLKLTRNKNIHQNYRRLIFSIQEPNVSLGFIKECSFSPDGRIICSPYGSSFRLLAFSPNVAQPWQCFPDKPPATLHVVWNKGISHKTEDAIVSTEFSVLDNSLIVGSLCGNISVHYPFR